MTKVMKQIFIVKLPIFLVSMILSMYASAQTASPTVSFYSIDEEAQVELSPGESATVQAPLEMTMKANVEDASGYTYKCEWKIDRTTKGDVIPIIDRFDEDTEYTITSSGSYSIVLYITFTDSKGDVIEYESEPFTVVISESTLSCPDGFSPNGDGINDVFKVTYKSIIKMEGTFFNRWGQKLYSFNLNNVDQGWDGRYGGNYIKNGVYFLNLYAVGSDGIEYKIKKAVNVLKGFRENAEGGPQQ